MPSEPESVLDTRAPRFVDGQIEQVLATHWGIEPRTLGQLPSDRDLNVLVDDRFVLKVSNPAEQPSLVDLEDVSLAHVRRVAPDLPVPDQVEPTSGPVVRVTDAAGRECLARLITVVPGTMLEGIPITLDLAEQVGAMAARTSLALQGLFHPAADRVLDWDVRLAPEVLARPGVLDGLGEQGRVLEPRLDALAAAAEATKAMPSGLQHADVTLTNVLVTDGTLTGLIDFGDMHHTAAVCDLAVTLTSVLRNTADVQLHDVWELTAATLLGYQRHRQLTPAEVDVLGDLVLARLALTLAIAARRIVTEVDNIDYIGQYDDLLERRLSAMGGPIAPLFYGEPLEIVRGEGSWLIAADGTRYLDAYNNVAVVGHAHPAVVGAVSRQLAELNTHSRYLHPRIVELAERLLATVHDDLDTCLFTTSGTEANELVWRMATAHTGGNAAIVAEHAYHGSSAWMADLSPNEWPEGYRPAHVATFAAPRSATGGTDHSTGRGRIAAAAEDLARRGDRPALVLADIGFTSEGILDAPAEFLAGLVDGAHSAGALFLADEVQSGFGRSGPQMWRFAAARITPDFVTLGKPMGAGYPIGAVITRREIADSLARDYEYFSTFAATPVAAAAACAVLDVLETNRIPESAMRVGEHLRARLRELAEQSALLGEIRGGRPPGRHRPGRAGRRGGARVRHGSA